MTGGCHSLSRTFGPDTVLLPAAGQVVRGLGCNSPGLLDPPPLPNILSKKVILIKSTIYKPYIMKKLNLILLLVFVSSVVFSQTEIGGSIYNSVLTLIKANSPYKLKSGFWGSLQRVF